MNEKIESGRITTAEVLAGLEGARNSGDPFRRASVIFLANLAAGFLGSMPRRQRRRWSGWIGDEHYWRGRRAILPDGQTVEVLGVLRGEALVSWPDPAWIDGVRRLVVPAEKLRVFKLPAAVVLGRLKRGRKEKPSELKRTTCRQNGLAPCRPGSRPRGRPRKPVATA